MKYQTGNIKRDILKRRDENKPADNDYSVGQNGWDG